LQNAWGYIPSDWLSILQKQKQQTRYRLALLKPDFAAFAMNYIHDSKDAYLADSIYMRQMGYVNGGYLQERIESWAILGERHGIDYVYPYIDKRLVEFALALPSQWYYRLGKHRYLYRQAINSRLHDTIKNKGKPAETKRVRQLIKNYHASLCHSSALQRIADTPSVYVDAHSLLVHIMRLRELDLNRCKLYDFEIVALFDLTATFNLSGMH
jgi:hypothetical protein